MIASTIFMVPLVNVICRFIHNWSALSLTNGCTRAVFRQKRNKITPERTTCNARQSYASRRNEEGSNFHLFSESFTFQHVSCTRCHVVTRSRNIFTYRKRMLLGYPVRVKGQKAPGKATVSDNLTVPDKYVFFNF